MKQSSTPDQTIQLERTIPYTPDEIYAAFADPVRLAKWWGPKDFTNSFEIFEFTVGGRWKFIMHGPDGSNYQNESVFSVLEPGKKIIIQHTSQPHFTLSVTLLPIETGTRVLWSSAFEDPKVVAAIRHIAEPGAEQNLDRLHQHLRGELK
jgi:uncharacterized protein YndB with AHSA1/START domain